MDFRNLSSLLILTFVFSLAQCVQQNITFETGIHTNLRSKQKHTGISESNRPRCQRNRGGFEGLKHLISQSMWKKTNLTWSIIKYSQSRPKLPNDDVKRAITQAFRVWSHKSNLTFHHKVKNLHQADFTIAFERYDHGDGYRFDGNGNTVAHAFFPSEGKIHFDDSEVWTAPGSKVNQKTGTNLLAVAVHEIGHALGLHHARSQKSIMYPIYTGDSNLPPKLSTRDINAIRYLYGPCNPMTSQNKQPNHIPAHNPTNNRNNQQPRYPTTHQKDGNRQPNHIPAKNPTWNNQQPRYPTTQSPRFRYNQWG